MPLAALAQRLLLLAVLILSGAAGAGAQQVTNPVDDAAGRAERQVEGFRGTLAQAGQTVTRPAVSNEQLTSTRADIERIRIDATLAAERLTSPLSDLQAQLKKLPPPPAKDATEPQAIAGERQRLTTLIERLTAARSQLGLVAVEAEQLAAKVAATQRERFFEWVFEPSKSILNPSMWTSGASGLVVMAERIGVLVLNWRAAAKETYALPGLVALLALGAIAAVALLIGNWALRRVRSDAAPDDLTRLSRAVLAIVICVAVTQIGFEAAELVMDRLGLMVGRIGQVLDAAQGAILILVAFWTFAAAVFRPATPAWRIVAADDRAATSQATVLVLAGLVIASARFLFDMASAVFAPVEASHLVSGLSAGSLVALAAATLVSLGPAGAAPTDTSHVFGWLRRLSPLIWVLLAIAAAALALGYIALGDFIATKLFETVLIVSFLLMLHYLADAAVTASVDPASPTAAFLRERAAISRKAVERLGLVFSTAVDLALVVAGVPLLFGLWWFNWIDYGTVVSAFFTGFQVGDVTVTPWSIVLAALIFVTGLVLVRLAAYWLDRRVLSRASFDEGVRNSILTGTRYILTAVAVIFAATAAGLDFSNLAIVAGALGVGIGFGLQSIVNNFVSGLILLAERPIKVGDWVILTGGEGIVKRINVRSTEIETFDRATVIVPNSSLISDVVKNRTHADRLGRSLVTVSVEYGGDPARVSAILEDIGRSHPSALMLPAPFARFVNFGEFGMDFSLYVFIGEVSDVATVESDLRFEIWRRFAAEGIAIATPLKETHARHHGRARRQGKAP
jgi:small-conductance mechanosensitive channel